MSYLYKDETLEFIAFFIIEILKSFINALSGVGFKSCALNANWYNHKIQIAIFEKFCFYYNNK